VLTIRLDALAGDAARLCLGGHLDNAGARAVLQTAADLTRGGCSRLVVDLDGVTSWDGEATFAVVGCTRLARWLSHGVEVVGASPAARELALEAGVAPASGSDAAEDDPAACPSPSPAPDTMAACRAC
jgi:hypothetical protein